MQREGMDLLSGLQNFVRHASRDPEYLQMLANRPEMVPGKKEVSQDLIEARKALIFAASKIGVMDCVAGG